MKYSNIHRESHGFTLVELVIVIAVIALLTTIGVLSITAVQNRTELAARETAAATIADDLTAYFRENGEMPTSITGLGDPSLVSDATEGWHYTSSDTTFCLSTSVGSDKYHYTETSGEMLDGACPIQTLTVGSHRTFGVSDGRLYQWWDVASANPIQTLSTLENKEVTAAVPGDQNFCAIAEGELYCWGNNGYGQLGLGDTNSRTNPELVQGALAGKTVVKASAASDQMCAIVDAGSLYCWGRNVAGAIGSGDILQYASPNLVQGLFTGKTVTDISNGHYFTCGIADKYAYCWGQGSAGELGYNSPLGGGYYYYPYLVAGDLAGREVTAITSG
ncbi:hypothetical protein B7Z28_02185, partial [Candidatus Saccharibacteria bacterium 32-45-3]